MAQPDRECTLYVFGNSGRGRWHGIPLDMNLLKPLSHIYFPGIFTRQRDFRRNRRSSFSVYPSLYIRAG